MAAGRLEFIDKSYDPSTEDVVNGQFDVSGLRQTIINSGSRIKWIWIVLVQEVLPGEDVSIVGYPRGIENVHRDGDVVQAVLGVVAGQPELGLVCAYIEITAAEGYIDVNCLIGRDNAGSVAD